MFLELAAVTSSEDGIKANSQQIICIKHTSDNGQSPTQYEPFEAKAHLNNI
jgi:hypothetical protein